MTSEPNADDVVAATKAFKSRMAKFLLKGKSNSGDESLEIDARTAVVLQRNGVFREIVPLPMNDIDPRVVSDSSHPNRLSFGAGPLLFVQAPGANQRTVIKASQLLFSSTVQLRAAAMDFFHTIGAQHQALTANSIRKLDELRPQVLSTALSEWQDAAIAAHDFVEDDWLCNLAGTRQCAFARFDEGYTDYFSKVIRPPIRSIEQLEIKVWEPSTQCDSLSRAIADIVETSASFSSALSNYFYNFGHIPLDGAYAASGVFKIWLERRTPGDATWATLWEWAEGMQHPLARYHVCQLLSRHPQLIPDGMYSQFWHEVVQIVHLPEAPSTPGAQSWLLLCEVARHFCHYLEALTPGLPGERITNLAWWLSRHLLEIFKNDEDVMKQVRESMSTQFEMSSHVWRLLTPPTGHSDFRYGTLWLKSIWSAAMINQLDLQAAHLTSESFPELGPITSAVKGHLLSMLPLKAEESSIYAFRHRALEAAAGWAKICPAEDAELINELISANVKLSERDFQAKLLDSLGMGSVADDVLLASALRRLAYVGTAPDELLWEKLNDGSWRENALIKTNHPAMELIVDTLLTVGLTSGEKWLSHLPHFFALTAEKATGAERRKALFGVVVMSSIATSTTSAVRRIVSGPHRVQFADDVREWRQQLVDVIPWGSAWAVARMRSVLANLSL